MNKNMIAKDNLITRILELLSKYKSATIVLKGGTSLTKGYRIGERMSEDADLVFFLDKPISNSQYSRIAYEIRAMIKNNFNVLKEKPLGGGGIHYSAEIDVKGNKGDNIKLDIRASKTPVANCIVDIHEFNQENK